MDALIVIILIVILFVILQDRRKVSDQVKRLANQSDEILVMLYKMQKQQKTAEVLEKEAEKGIEKVSEKIVEKVSEKNAEKIPEIITEKVPEKIIEKGIDKPLIEPVKKPSVSRFAGMFDMFSDRKRTEEFIGGNLLNKIGIVVLVLGLAYSVKYAIDQDWIGTVGRVAIGILAGGALIVIAHFLRKKYNAFSSVLVGGGLATLYFTISLAFHEYQLFAVEVAFVIMLIITGFAVALALAYDRIELAVFALFGGFASPLLVSTGQGNYMVFFTYLLILDAGMLILAYFKKWNLINIITYICTVLLYAAWFISTEDSPKILPYKGALIFASAFYLVFFVMNIINSLHKKTSISAIETGILLSNTFLYYGVGLYCIEEINPQMKGIFTAILGIFNFAFAYSFYRNSKIDRRIVYLLIGLVLTFLSLTAPAQLEGNYITIFWAAEAALLLWLYTKSELAIARYTSVVVLLLMLISWMMDIDDIYISYHEEALQLVFNKGFITGLMATLSIVLSAFILQSKEKTELFLFKFTTGVYQGFLILLAIVALYATCQFELYNQGFSYTGLYETSTLLTGTFNVFYLVLLMFFGSKFKIKWFLPMVYLLTLLFSFSFISYYQTDIFVYLRNYYLQNKITFTLFGFHYVSIVLFFVLLAFALKNVHLLPFDTEKVEKIVQWFAVFFGVYVLSIESEHLFTLIKYQTPLLEKIAPEYFEYEFEIAFTKIITDIQEFTYRAAYPVLWGVCSFSLMIAGLQLKQLNLRIIALTLFFITLIKLFAIDVWQMPAGGKIIAFILLGVLLLVISFLYQKLKQIILETGDETEEEAEKK